MLLFIIMKSVCQEWHTEGLHSKLTSVSDYLCLFASRPEDFMSKISFLLITKKLCDLLFEFWRLTYFEPFKITNNLSFHFQCFCCFQVTVGCPEKFLPLMHHLESSTT